MSYFYWRLVKNTGVDLLMKFAWLVFNPRPILESKCITFNQSIIWQQWGVVNLRNTLFSQLWLFSGCIIVLVGEIWQAPSQMWTVNLATMKKAWAQGQNPKYGTEPGLGDTCSEYTSLNVFVIRGLSLISGGQEFVMISCFC